jgi:hypothetical protein
MPILERSRQIGQSSESFSHSDTLRGLAQDLLLKRYSILSAKDIPLDVAQHAFKQLEAASLKEAFLGPSDQPIIFRTLEIHTEELVESVGENPSTALFDRLEKQIQSHEVYITRAQEALESKLNFLYRKPGEPLSGQEIIHRLCKIQFDDQTTRLPIRMREILKHFGNPTTYPLDDYGGKYYEEADPSYPMIFPLITLYFDHPPEGDVKDFYANFNKRYAAVEKQFDDNSLKIVDAFSLDELQTVRESALLVDFVDGWLYQSYGLPHTRFAMATSLSPYEAIAQRYGYRYEKWLGRGPNDELTDTMKSGLVTASY